MEEIFPFKNHFIYLNFCGIAPLHPHALKKKIEFEKKHSQLGAFVFNEYPDLLKKFRDQFAKLLKTSPENISFVKNTAEGLSLIANGYPFEPDDEILSYIHEYPSNHYPWKMQEFKKRAKLKLIKNNPKLALNAKEISKDYPIGFSLRDIENLTTKKTKVLAISSVQFTSGFAANLKEIGKFCKENQIDLVVDAAQSLGSLPLYPEEYHISAIASSGWKWLMGPIGSGILYTSKEFREKIEVTMAGADLMLQGSDYLNHTWQPYTDGRKFEYSTLPYSDILALTICAEFLFHESIESIQERIFYLHRIFKENCKNQKIRFLEFNKENQSGILSLVVENPNQIVSILKENRILCTVRGNFVRVAPHFMITEQEIEKVVDVMNQIK
ncbi:MAG: aminotransferase class V-fold PLP-dependent enzyme [Leptonema sp. (in: bacteria)]